MSKGNTRSRRRARRIVLDMRGEALTPEQVNLLAARDGVTTSLAIKRALLKTFPHWFPEAGDVTRFVSGGFSTRVTYRKPAVNPAPVSAERRADPAYRPRITTDIYDDYYTPAQIRRMAALDGLTISGAIRKALAATYPHWFPSKEAAAAFARVP